MIYRKLCTHDIYTESLHMYMNVEVAALHVMKSQLFHGIMITYIRGCRNLTDINALEGARVAIRAVTGFSEDLANMFLLMSSCPFIGDQPLLRQMA